MTVVDSHLHVWELERGGYDWLGPQHGSLHRSFPPAEAAEELVASGVGTAILVQAEDSVRESAYLLEVARTNPWVHGVVGWIRLDTPETAEAQLEELSSPALRGIRHLVHDDPRDDFFDLAPVRQSLRSVADRGLVLDIPDAWPRHLEAAQRLADALPGLTIVMDHLAKPPSDAAELALWDKALRQLAERPNVRAKVSGLQAPDRPITADALRGLADVALEAFGVERLMFGSDWPMTTEFGGYPASLAATRGLVAQLSHDEQDALLHGTAIDTYGRSLHE